MRARDLGKISKMGNQVGPLDIEYKPRSAIKGQVIVDFLTEIPKEDVNEAKVERCQETQTQDEVWDLYTDGASNDEWSGVGLILISPEKTELTYALRLDFKSSSNEAEYEALLAGLRLAHKMKARRVRAHVDSLLVANQVSGPYEAKEASMKQYLVKAQELIKSFDNCVVIHVPQE
jgi:ribonuclease HI